MALKNNTPCPNVRINSCGQSFAFEQLLHCNERLRCDDGNTQTANDICNSGTCQGCPVLSGLNDCEVAPGTFDAVTQNCSAPTLKADGATCDSETTDKFGATFKHNTACPKSRNQLMCTDLPSRWSS